MKTILYHNPRCSKSRQALALLTEKNIDIDIREYLKEPLTSVELSALIASLKVEPHNLLRSKEAEYKQANLSKKSTKDEIIQAIVDFPKLMERPIVTTVKGSRIGRPTDSIEEIL